MQNLDIALKNLRISAFPPLEALPLLPTEMHLFVFCKRGSFLYFSDKNAYIVRENQLALFPRGQVKWIHTLPDRPLSLIVFPMHAACHHTDLFAFFDLTAEALVVDMPPEHIQKIYKGMQKAERFTSEYLRDLSRTTYAAELCTFYLKERTEAETDENLFRTVFTYMETHLAEDISLDTLSGLMHYNPIYFSQKFKDKTGLSPIKYLALLRMQNAARLLISTDLSIPKVGTASGFQSAYYFRTSFSKYVGLSPDDFRRKYGTGDIG